MMLPSASNSRRRQVEALEANDFPHLPQATFLRGFVRSYARMLKLDEVALIACFA